MNYEPIQKSAERSASILERFVRGIIPHWRQSLAKIIWDDLTPFGRLTIWLPLWVLCWVVMPLALLCCFVPFLWFKVYGKLPDVPPIFFKR